MSAAAAAAVFLLAQLGEARVLHSRSAVTRSVKRLHLLFISLTTCQRQPRSAGLCLNFTTSASHYFSRLSVCVQCYVCVCVSNYKHSLLFP